MKWNQAPWRFLIGFAVVCAASAADPALTIYNQKFAVVRDTVKLNLKRGLNQVTFNETTAHLEPDSVILRDPTGKRTLQILEQNYRADPVSQQLLLSLYEGKSIEFLVQRGDKKEVVKGKIVRSGYVPHQTGMRLYGSAYAAAQTAYAYGASGQPVIEVDGTLRFSLPGEPLFPALTDETILKPTIHWVLDSDQPGDVDAELTYVTGGMSWEADYNVVAPQDGDVLDMLGWVTMDNQSGKSFPEARIKLVAGDVSKIQPEEGYDYSRFARAGGMGGAGPPVTEKTFDEYHLYSLNRKTTLHDRETKQVEFIRAGGIKSQRIYVYEGAWIDRQRYRGWSPDSVRQDPNYGTQSNPKVWVMREFTNSEKNKLGMPLPKGRLRFYRRDTDGQLEFVGENDIDHTAKNELVRMFTGNAFDLTGERRRTDFKVDHSKDMIDESFEIKLRNQKKERVEIRVVERLYRWSSWEITEKSHAYSKTESQTIEFRMDVKPDEEKVITYTVHYTW